MKTVLIKKWAIVLKKVPIRDEDAAFFISVGKIREEAQSTLAGLRKRDIGGSDERVAPNRVSIE